MGNDKIGLNLQYLFSVKKKNGKILSPPNNRCFSFNVPGRFTIYQPTLTLGKGGSQFNCIDYIFYNIRAPFLV